MAIVKMNKFTLLAFESQKDKLLEELQKFEGVHFVNLQEEELLEKHEELKTLKKDGLNSKYSEYEENLSKIKFSLDFLNKYIPQKSGIKALMEGKRTLSFSEIDGLVEKSNWKQTYTSLKDKENLLSQLYNEKSKYETEIAFLKNWENFDASFKDLKNLKMVSYFAGTIAKQYGEAFKSDFEAAVTAGYYEIINVDNQDMYLLAIVNKEDMEKTYEIMKRYGFNSLPLTYDENPKKLIQNYSSRINGICKELEDARNEIMSYEQRLPELELAFDYYSNGLIRMNASMNFLKTGNVIAIVGWNPSDLNDELDSAVKTSVGDNYVLTFNEVSEDEIEEVPIRLKNNKMVSAFESITEMYSLPLYNEIDPTPLLTPFYFAFFGMMVGDAGYGIVVAIAAILALRFLKLDEKTKNFVRFFFYLGIASTIFGAIYGSYFGDAIKIPGLINPGKDINTILIMSIVFGVIQIFFGLGIKAYMIIRDGKYLEAFYDVGSWVMALVGAGLFGAGSMIGLSPSGITIAKYVMFAGMILIVATQGRAAKSFGARLGSGLYALYGITSYVGDLVSYTRLMALGIAGGSIAGALNLLISYFPGISLFIVGPIFFVLAQVFNLLLSLLGAYVHTCRLQYVEFFSKFYGGGGKPFAPLKFLNKYIELKRD
jgi:V/A-type H+/Na+-transporting ATPase subunit I